MAKSVSVQIPRVLYYDLVWLINNVDERNLPPAQRDAVLRCRDGLQRKHETHQRRLDYTAEIERRRKAANRQD